MRFRISAAHIFIRTVSILMLCTILLTGCVGVHSKSFISSAADILSLPYLNLNFSAFCNNSKEAAAAYGGLLPQQFTLTINGGIAENLSKYDITINIKQPDSKSEPLLRVYGSGMDMYVQALSYPNLLPELLFYKNDINEFEYEHIMNAFESGIALRVDLGALLSNISDNNQAVLFISSLLDEYAGLDYSGFYSSLADIATDNIDKLSEGLKHKAYGTGWVKYKTDGATLSAVLDDALELISDSAGEVSDSMIIFLSTNRTAFADSFRMDYQRSKSAGGLVPDFNTFEGERFDALLEDASGISEGLKKISEALKQVLEDRQEINNEEGIKTVSEIVLSGASEKVSLRGITDEKMSGMFYASSDIKLTLTRGADFQLPAVKYMELTKVLWNAAKDFYKSEDHKAEFLHFDYNSLTASVTTVSQDYHEYTIEGISQSYFNIETLGGTAKPEDAAIVPARFACEVFGEVVNWDESSGRAYVERNTEEGVKKLFLTGKLCGDKLFVSARELSKLGIVCFVDSIYSFELAK